MLHGPDGDGAVAAHGDHARTQYPPMPLVRWCADRNAASRVFIAGTEGWAAAQPRLAP